MARQFARIDLNIWDNDDFRQLSGEAQRLYMMLLSYRTTSSAGMLPIQPTRWARHSETTTPEDIRMSLAELIERRYVVVDLRSEELLIRSFIYHDGLGNWKHKKGIESSIAVIESPALKALAQASFDRALAGEDDEQAPPIDVLDPIDCQSIANPTPTDSPIDTPIAFILHPAACSLDSVPALGSGVEATEDVAAAALSILIEHKVSTTAKSNPAALRKMLERELPIEHGTAIKRYLRLHPEATAQEIAANVLNMPTAKPIVGEVTWHLDPKCTLHDDAGQVCVDTRGQGTFKACDCYRREPYPNSNVIPIGRTA